MKRFLVAFKADVIRKELNPVFTVMVTDETETASALRLGNHLRFLWAERAGGVVLAKLVPPQPPFNFLPSAVPAEKKS